MRRGTFGLLIVLVAVAAHGQVIAVKSGSPQLLIPAAGAVMGANGQTFRSDIAVLNYRNEDQLVEFRWLPEGSSGVSVPPVQIMMKAGTGVSSEDFVTTILNQSGLGALLITGMNSSGFLDFGANLVASSRIWSNPPGSTVGTVSQTFPVLSTVDINSSPALAILGVRLDSRFRMNLGIVNLDPNSVETFRVVAGNSTSGTTTFNVQVQPFSMQQVNVPAGAGSPLQILITPLTNPSFSNWTAYASSVDNTTGDSWSAIGYVPKVAP